LPLPSAAAAAPPAQDVDRGGRAGSEATRVRQCPGPLATAACRATKRGPPPAACFASGLPPAPARGHPGPRFFFPLCPRHAFAHTPTPVGRRSPQCASSIGRDRPKGGVRPLYSSFWGSCGRAVERSKSAKRRQGQPRSLLPIRRSWSMELFSARRSLVETTEGLMIEASRHVPLRSEPWAQGAAVQAIDDIVADALGQFGDDRFWPAYPTDGGLKDGDSSIYSGAAGVIWALEHLKRVGATKANFDFRPYLPQLLEKTKKGDGDLRGLCEQRITAVRRHGNGAADHASGAQLCSRRPGLHAR
jgi:hypothetical protein